MLSAEKKINRKCGTFELLGCDILFDENLKPHLLEINTNPAIFTGISININQFYFIYFRY